MIAEVISIGDELTSGQRLDTNSQWLSDQLGQLGVRVMYHTTVADDLAANIAVFQAAAARADVIVATGGLGPTADDLTREALAAVAGQPLVLDQASLDYIRGIFERFKREMPERNRVQALFPEGSQVIPNAKGTAPGIYLQLARGSGGVCHVFALPGVPMEMFPMFADSVAPQVLKVRATTRRIRHHRIKVFGAGESHVEQMLPDLIRRGREPSVGITVHDATITLRITAEGASDEEWQGAIEPTVRTIHECLGSLVFGQEEDELEDAVLRQLTASGLTLATVEVGSGGHLAAMLGRKLLGAESFLGGQVIHSDTMLAKVLGEDSRLVAAHGADSREVAEALAVRCRRSMAADLALAIGPFPVDSQQHPEKPFHYALAMPQRTIVKASSMSHWQSRASKMALNLLRLALLGEL